MRTERNWFQPSREGSDICHVIIFLNMFSGPSNGYTVQYFKEIKVQHFKQTFCCAVAGFPFTPSVKCPLCILKNFIYRTCRIELFVYVIRMPFISKGKLIFQVIETVIYRCGRKHQHFCFDTSSDNLFHQGDITIILCVIIRVVYYFSAVAEVVGLVNDDKRIGVPANS